VPSPRLACFPLPSGEPSRQRMRSAARGPRRRSAATLDIKRTARVGCPDSAMVATVSANGPQVATKDVKATHNGQRSPFLWRKWPTNIRTRLSVARDVRGGWQKSVLRPVPRCPPFTRACPTTMKVLPRRPPKPFSGSPAAACETERACPPNHPRVSGTLIRANRRNETGIPISADQR
jgi:hypothetical protein